MGIPKPTLLSRIMSRLSGSFGYKYYVYKFKLPLPCCEWCKSQGEKAERKWRELEQRIAQMERRPGAQGEFGASQPSEEFRLKMEAALRVFDHVMTAYLKQDYIITSPVEVTRAFNAALEAVDGLTSSSRGADKPTEEETAFDDAMQRAVRTRPFPKQNGHIPGAPTPQDNLIHQNSNSIKST